LPAGEVDKLGVVIGDKLYFAAFRGDTAATFTGVELWSTDGTPEGTTLVKDILPGVGSSLPQWLTVFDEGRVNAAPSAVTLANKTTMIAENTATTSRIKVADIVVTDDGLGTNALSVTGTDAARFEIVGTVLYIKPGQTLDFETNASYSVAVQVNDASVGGSPDVISAIYSLAIGNVSPETLTGDAAANMLIGGIDRDIISGLGGNDTLNGGAGNDTLIGGTGNDIYIVNAGDNITEFVGQGTADRVRTVATFALAAGANIEFLETTNAALTTKLNLTGNEIAQAVTGNAGINALSGLGGNDTLRGESGHDTIYGGIGNDNAYGGTGNDKLYGQAGNDTLRGDAGVDWLAGAAGRDVLYGGADRDILDFNSLADSRGSTRDFLADFLRRVDDIDVSTIDANMKLAGNQRFTFIGDKTFTKKAGELHYVKSGSNVRVEGDVNGDAKADFAIDVKGTAALTSGDFIL
jgi:ELWxxDGT repeat protein